MRICLPQTKREEPAKPKKKSKMMMSIGPIKSLGTNPPSADATNEVAQGEPEESIGSISRRRTPPRDTGPREAASSSGPSGVKSALGVKRAKDYSAEVAGPVQVPTLVAKSSAGDEANQP
eukprot:651387-Pyramimonas_sp.AAC.1